MIYPLVSGEESFEEELVNTVARRYVEANPSTIVLELKWKRDHWHVWAVAKLGDAKEVVSSSVVRLLRSEGLPARESR